MGSDRATKEQVENSNAVGMKASGTASIYPFESCSLASLVHGLNFSCCSFTQLSQCIYPTPLGPPSTSSDIPSPGGLFSLLHHLLLTQRLPSLCCHSSSDMSISGHSSHCSYVFPCPFLHLSESWEGQVTFLFQLCTSSSK